MKKLLATLSIAAAIALFTGCAGAIPFGAIYTDTTLPSTATSASGSSKEGKATCTSILGLVAMGDCSVDAAAKEGHITTIRSVDSKVFSILGIFATYTTTVKGN